MILQVYVTEERKRIQVWGTSVIATFLLDKNVRFSTIEKDFAGFGVVLRWVVPSLDAFCKPDSVSTPVYQWEN